MTDYGASWLDADGIGRSHRLVTVGMFCGFSDGFLIWKSIRFAIERSLVHYSVTLINTLNVSLTIRNGWFFNVKISH